MTSEILGLPGARAPKRPRGEALFELRRRTFDTPEFRGMTFIEVEAKTVINRVPGSFLPFNWTINPYRGCSHSCSYCMSGETPILMADGRTKPLADIRVGDEIYGTVRVGNYRRLTKTRVLDHWSTVRRAYRVRLEDGTEIIASGDHRFLTERGWKHVTGREQGAGRRPNLTTSDRLLGLGRMSATPKACDDYRRGYLCGMIRGDGHLGSYAYPREVRALGDVHRFRLALVDMEALRRTRDYLRHFRVETKEFLLTAASGTHSAMQGIRTSAAGSVGAIEALVGWPLRPPDEWCRGYLAGVFDAEGSYRGGNLRIGNTNPFIIGYAARSLARLGFRFRVEQQRGRNGMRYVRLLGGARVALRFFQVVDPATTRKSSLEGTAIKSSDAQSRIASIESLGIDVPMYDITTETGDFVASGVVSHNCFARVTHTYMNMNAGSDFETKIVVKVNAPDVLRRQLASKRWKGESIAMGTATDPYQRAEGRYRLMPGIIGALTDYRNPFSILTKGTLILRDLHLLRAAGEVADVSTAMSIPTLDEDVWRRSEPGTPPPRKRIEAVREMNRAGIPCGVLVAPVLPGISDRPEQLRAVVEACLDAGATHVSPILLHLRPVVREEYMSWLAREYPDLLPRYEQMYATSPYAPPADRKALGRSVGNLVRRAGGVRPSDAVAARFDRERSRAREPQPEPARQMRLI